MKNLSYLLNVVLTIAVAILAVMVWHEHEMLEACQSAWQYVYDLKLEEVDEYYVSLDEYYEIEEQAYESLLEMRDEYDAKYSDMLEEYHELELEYTELEKEYELFEDIMDEVLWDYELTIVKEEE